LGLGLGTSLVTLWSLDSTLALLCADCTTDPPLVLRDKGALRDELIVLGFFLKVSHFTFRMIFCALFQLARNLSSCCPTEVSSCRFVGKTTPLAVRIMQDSYGIMHMHILAAFQCTELTSPQYVFRRPSLTATVLFQRPLDNCGAGQR
jgi:hypothetical protein